MELSVLVAFCSCFAPALGSAFGREMTASTMDDTKDADSAFHYDYESLRIGGLVFAVVFFLMGIFLIVSRKCTCSKSERPKPRVPDAEKGVAKGKQMTASVATGRQQWTRLDISKSA
ncbi:FXYD domain containing ion transport regulator 5 [Aplochiton taeniatus]